MLTFSAAVSPATAFASTSPISSAELPRSGSVRILTPSSSAGALQIAFYSLPIEPAALPPSSPGWLQKSVGATPVLCAAQLLDRSDHHSQHSAHQSRRSIVLLFSPYGHVQLRVDAQPEQFVTRDSFRLRYLPTRRRNILTNKPMPARLRLLTRA